MALRLLPPRALLGAIFAFLAGGLLFGVAGCHKKADAGSTPASSASGAASQAPRSLTPEQAQQVLARVGDRTITLGDYAAALERMDTFERLRYQSPDRRRLLLNEMIELELLAQEAKRRGLDKQPETQERIRQMLRDELLRDVRKGAPSPADVPEADVRKYYDEHKADFAEPERRRVAHIAVTSASEAKQLIAKAQGASNADWGKLVSQSSLDKGNKALGPAPAELAGDLGIVGPPGHPRGANPRVPEALRAAVFKIEKVGGVLPEPVADGGSFHVVRLSSRSDARERSFEEAERTIRVTLVQAELKEREAKLEAELKNKYPVTIDDAALAKVHAPKAAPSAPSTARPPP
jgi:peptidyl-prolyl cis-trans isomerase C